MCEGEISDRYQSKCDFLLPSLHPIRIYCIILHTIEKEIIFLVPRLYGEKLHYRYINPRNKRVQRRIVMLHDFFRTKVVPPAANMLSMVS